jgi:DNA-binding transcriptional MocR family regulator
MATSSSSASRREKHDVATKNTGDKPAKLRIKLSDRSGESGSGQVARQVRELIAGGRLKAGDMLPSEDGLAEQLGVGRKIVRYAYDKLVDEGVLVRNIGRNKRVAGAGGKGKAAGGKGTKGSGATSKKSAKKR